MSAHQMICHLSDTFRMGLGEREEPYTGGVFDRLVIKNLALRVPLPWSKGYPAPPGVAQEIGGSPPTNFGRDHDNLVVLIERFRSLPREHAFPLHPFWGKLRWSEWMIWGYRHCDHHLRQFSA
jgi:hypothetical protein